jgi:endoglucanase
VDLATHRLRRMTLLAGAALAAGGLGAAPLTGSAASQSAGRSLPANTRFYVPPPAQGSAEEVLQLLRRGDVKDAGLIAAMEATPQAVWLDGETAAQAAEGSRGEVQADVDVMRQVHEAVLGAAFQRAVPVFVAYNIPGRDCSQYSAGGAPSDAAYQDWINWLARGLGDAKALILVEPDGLANLPSDCGATYEQANPKITDATREGDILDAVVTLEKDPNSDVYIDAGHSAWQSVGTIAQRLLSAGVQKAQGFFLNVSNYQYATNNVFFGTWVSDCIAYGTLVNPGDSNLATDCPNQYWNGGPATGWQGKAMSPYGLWSEGNGVLQLNTAGIDSRYGPAGAGQGGDLLGSVTPTTRFVIDTSRDGLGPNDMEMYYGSPYDQPQSVVGSDPTQQYPDNPPPTGTLQSGNWCNPPDSGLGLRPTADTASVSPLLDAYLWVKTPGQSDGQCDLAGGVRDWQDFTAPGPGGGDTPPISGWPTGSSSDWTTFDPLWSLQTSSVFTDPAAGAWFPQQALQLARNAAPPLSVRP